MSSPPPTPGYFSDNPHHTPQMPGYDPSGPRRGMVTHVRIIAIMSMVQGGLELIMAAMYFLIGGLFGTVLGAEMAKQAQNQGDPNGQLFINFMTIFMLGLGGLMLIGAGLRIYAGYRNFFFQSRVLGIVSACVGLLAAFSVYCAPTAIGVAIYGLIVLFNKEVTDAFAMREKGASADDVINTFNSRPS